MKRCLRLFVVREMYIKTTMKYHLQEWLRNKKDKQYQVLSIMWKNGNSHTLQANNGIAAWGNNLAVKYEGKHTYVCLIYMFSTAVTNYHKFHGLKLHPFISS